MAKRTTPRQAAGSAAGTAIRVGVIGLGMIGGGVAMRVAAAGFPLVTFDIRPDAADTLEGVDPVLAHPVDVASASDVVLIAVVDADQAREVLFGENGLLTDGREGLLIGLLSTVALSALHDLAVLCAKGGATLFDAGVTQYGGRILVTMVGGAPEVFERARPVLQAFARDVVHCGPLGAGMLTKIARNLVAYTQWAATREAAMIAASGGVDPATFLEVLRKAVDGGAPPTAMLDRRLSDPDTALRRAPITNALAQKDLRAVQEWGDDHGIDTPIADVVRPRMLASVEGTLTDPRPSDA